MFEVFLVEKSEVFGNPLLTISQGIRRKVDLPLYYLNLSLPLALVGLSLFRCLSISLIFGNCRLSPLYILAWGDLVSGAVLFGNVYSKG